MKPRWDRIVAFGMLLFAFWLLVAYAPQFVWLVNQIGNISTPHARPEDRAFALLIAGICLVSVLCAVKLLTRRDP